MSNKTENYIWKVKLFLMKKYGCREADRDISALAWYCGTGRSSASFDNLLVSKPAYMVARKLHQGGSDEEIIARIKEYIGY